MSSSSGMQYVRVGTSGLKVSKVVLGCMSYGDPAWQPWVLPLEKALPIMKYAYDRGINTFDVADAYSNGQSERIVGAFLKEYNIPRSKIVIMTKIFFNVYDVGTGVEPVKQGMNDGEQVNQVGLNRKHIFEAVDRCLERLGVDYVDVLQIHRLDREITKEEIMRGLSDVVDSGKARYLGASSMAAWEFQMCQNVAEKHGWHKFISMQGLYNLLSREEEREMNPYCHATGVGLFPWSPLSAGVLTHSWEDKSDPRETHDVFLKALFREREDMADKEIVRRVGEVAKNKGVPMAQVAVAWVFGKGNFMPICGLMNEEQIDQAVAGVSVKLSEEEMKFLEQPYMPKPAMPF